MQDNFSALLRKAISQERLDAYSQHCADDSDLNLFPHYAWNIALCESLYPALHGLEVALRNSVHDAASDSFGSEFWFDNPDVISHARERGTISKVNVKLAQKGKPREAGRVVAELSFGFWTTLFEARYEQILWPSLLKTVIPSMPRPIRTRKTLSTRLHRIRHMRNRVFHHEPIWHWHDLAQQHSELCETVGWINPAMLDMIKVLDRFPDVHRLGVQPFQQAFAAMVEPGRSNPRPSAVERP